MGQMVTVQAFQRQCSSEENNSPQTLSVKSLKHCRWRDSLHNNLTRQYDVLLLQGQRVGTRIAMKPKKRSANDIAPRHLKGNEAEPSTTSENGFLPFFNRETWK